ncbi:inactive rhomboid protein 2-like [Argonauta hians]
MESGNPPDVQNSSIPEPVRVYSMPPMARAQGDVLHKRSRKQSIKESIAEFFGVGSENIKNVAEWNNRRLRYYSTIGKLKDSVYQSSTGDEVDSKITLDAPLKVIDPLKGAGGRISLSSGTSTLRRKEKKSVLSLAIKGITSVGTTKRKHSRNSLTSQRSYTPASLYADYSLQMPPSQVEKIEDDVFFDDIGEQISEVQEAKLYEPTLLSSPRSQTFVAPHQEGFRQPNEAEDVVDATSQSVSPVRRQVSLSSPGYEKIDEVDGAGIGLNKIKENVVLSSIFDKSTPRKWGSGVLTRLFKMKRASHLSDNIKSKIDELDNYRPFFTYWVTFVQTVIFLVSVAVYGFAPFGMGIHRESMSILMPTLTIDYKVYNEIRNMWLGPSRAHLIHLGAKYSPCMRVDKNIQKVISNDEKLESQSACCVRNDGSGCAQMIETQCSKTISSFYDKKEMFKMIGKETQTVCGLDPRFCKNPASQAPFEWAQNVLDWPICKEFIFQNHSKASKIDRHMSCYITARPCCHGILGECFITTNEHCKFLRGYFHEEAFLCSQVDCLDQICGMMPFVYKQKPDQFYRLFTTLFLHAGALHLLVTLVFQLLLMRDLEKLTGSTRIAIIYIVSGIAGNFASAIFLPYHVEAGPSGSQLGILSCFLVEIIHSWQIQKRPWRGVLKFALLMLFLFIIGLLPWIDNWAHLFGFLVGLCLAFALLPYVTFGSEDKKKKLIMIIVSLGFCLVFLVTLSILFYVSPIYQCDACQYFNCFPFLAPEYCENMKVSIAHESKYGNL